MTLTYKLDLDVLPLDLHAEIQVRMSVLLAMRVVTDTHTDDAKTITSDTSQTWGVMRKSRTGKFAANFFDHH